MALFSISMAMLPNCYKPNSRTAIRYRVNSLIRLPAKRNIFGGTAIDYWEERIGRRHYLQLPPRNISKRLRDKVAAVVKNVRIL